MLKLCLSIDRECWEPTLQTWICDFKWHFSAKLLEIMTFNLQMSSLHCLHWHPGLWYLGSGDGNNAGTGNIAEVLGACYCGINKHVVHRLKCKYLWCQVETAVRFHLRKNLKMAAFRAHQTIQNGTRYFVIRRQNHCEPINARGHMLKSPLWINVIQ